MIPVALDELAAYARLELTDHGYAVRTYGLVRDSLRHARVLLAKAQAEAFGERRAALFYFALGILQCADELRGYARRARDRATGGGAGGPNSVGSSDAGGRRASAPERFSR